LFVLIAMAFDMAIEFAVVFLREEPKEHVFFFEVVSLVGVLSSELNTDFEKRSRRRPIGDDPFGSRVQKGEQFGNSFVFTHQYLNGVHGDLPQLVGGPQHGLGRAVRQLAAVSSS
jgi:hypothetical protein